MKLLYAFGGATDAAHAGRRLATGSPAAGHVVAGLGHAQEVIAPMITGALFWKDEAWAACLRFWPNAPAGVTYNSSRPPPSPSSIVTRLSSSCGSRGSQPYPGAYGRQDKVLAGP